MQPPILKWKVMLALLVVVIGGASLGSALRSERTRDVTTVSLSVLEKVPIGTKVPIDAFKHAPVLVLRSRSDSECGTVEAEVRGVAPSLRPFMRRALRHFCH